MLYIRSLLFQPLCPRFSNQILRKPIIHLHLFDLWFPYLLKAFRFDETLLSRQRMLDYSISHYILVPFPLAARFGVIRRGSKRLGVCILDV